MHKESKIYSALSLCRRAGKLAMGFDPVADNVARGKAWLVLLAEYLSPKTKKRVLAYCEDMVPVYTMPLTQSDLVPITRKPVGVYAVLDENMAVLCTGSLETKEEISE